MPQKYDGIAWSNLMLTDSAWPNVVRKLEASNTLTFNQATYVNHKIKTAINYLDLIDQVTTDNVLYLEASNTLELSHSASHKGTLNVGVEDQLNLTHSAKSNLHYRNPSNQLNLTHEVRLVGRPIEVSASNNLAGGWEELSPEEILSVDPWDTEAVAALFADKGLRQDVSVKSRHNVSAQNFLSLSQEASQGPVVSASNHLHLTQSVELVEYEQVISYLNFQQSAVCYKVQSASSELELTHEAIVDGNFPRVASNALNLRSVVSYIVVNFCDYTPGVGEGNFDYTPPSIISPTLVRRSTTVLTWPYVTPTLTVELRNPNFDNVEQFEFRRINRRTRGGTLDLYRDESWPKVKRLIMAFTWLSVEQRQQLFNFLQRSLGTEIGLLDFESRQWRGLLLTPSAAIAEPKRNGHSFSLEFEGELV